MTDPLTYVLSCLRRAADNSYPWSLTPIEAGAVVAEVERLRAENAALVQTSADLCLACGWRFFVPGDGCQKCELDRLRAHRDSCTVNLLQGYETGKAEERTSVVAWLRKNANDTMTHPQTDRLAYARAYSALHTASDAIERGAHRREEEER